MTFEGEEELFNRTAATIQPGPLTDWLWSRGDEYAAHHPTRTTRQCQLAACLDYAEARHTAPK
jgi:hypothetical protein